MASKSRYRDVQAKATLPAVRGIDLLRVRYAMGEALLANPHVDAEQVEAWVRATSETLQRIFGEDTAATEFSSIEALEARLVVLEGLILRAEELYAEPLASHEGPKRVLLAAARDETTSRAVIEFLESLACIPIVCGRSGEPESAIEALDRHPDVGFAILMLAGAPNDGLLELGFLLGKLGRGRVCVVQSESLPAQHHYEPVLRVELDERGEWRDLIVKALRGAGITSS